MKLPGAAAILFASLIAALLKLRENRDRIRAYYDLQRSLLILRRELSERMTPLPVVLARLCEGAREGAACGFFRDLTAGMERLGEQSFSALWRGAAEERLSFLETENRERFALLGELLGGSELESQCRALADTAEELGKRAEELKRCEKEKQKTILGITLSFGAFIIILLM